jgi:hypothetical protein
MKRPFDQGCSRTDIESHSDIPEPTEPGTFNHPVWLNEQIVASQVERGLWSRTSDANLRLYITLWA